MSYLLCPGCYKIYKSENLKTTTIGGYNSYYFCPDVDCGEELFECDELMIQPVKKLNQKGYLTQFCCSGHDWGVNSGYIMFDTDGLDSDFFNLNKSFGEHPQDFDSVLEENPRYDYIESCYTNNLYLLDHLASRNIPKEWHLELGCHSTFENATFMANKLFAGTITSEALWSVDGEPNWYFPKIFPDDPVKTQETERNRVRALWDLYQSQFPPEQRKPFRGNIAIKDNGKEIIGFNFEDFSFMNSLYGIYCWDGKLTIRGDYDENIQYILRKDDDKNFDISKFIEDNQDDYDNLYKYISRLDAMVDLMVYVESLPSMDDFDYNEEECNGDCENCPHHGTTSDSSSPIQPYLDEDMYTEVED